MLPLGVRTPAPVAGPIERAVAAIAAARRAAAFRRHPRRAPRQRLVWSDALLEQVEHCRLEALPLVPSVVWTEVVRLVAAVDPHLRRRLGTNRHPDHVSGVLFDLQARLMLASQGQRPGRPAEIVQLFPS
ncbi:MAG TPA: hypothetical protein VMW47_13860 [Verrucomicrobiae bacterium]|nr:hypothetical protein [Verrucomicrobiae bacterium]